MKSLYQVTITIDEWEYSCIEAYNLILGYDTSLFPNLMHRLCAARQKSNGERTKTCTDVPLALWCTLQILLNI